MKVSIRFIVVPVLLSAFVLMGGGCASNGRKAPVPSLARKVAEAYGVSRWNEITELKYTFNVQSGDRRVKRSWTWEPKTGRVTYDGPGRDNQPVTINYVEGDVTKDSDEFMRRIDHSFINDQYWFLFPYHLVWDDNVTITETGMTPLPIGDGSARRLVVKFADTVGYTPGDMYELFIGDDNLIVQWVYHRAGAEDSYNPVTWEGNTHAGPILVSTDHTRPGGDFRLWFSDISVK